MATKTKAVKSRDLTPAEKAAVLAEQLVALRQTKAEVEAEIDEVEEQLRELVAPGEVVGDLVAYQSNGAATLKGASGKALDILKKQLMQEFPELAETKLNVTVLEGLLKTNVHLQNSLAAKGLTVERSTKVAFKAA